MAGRRIRCVMSLSFFDLKQLTRLSYYYIIWFLSLINSFWNLWTFQKWPWNLNGDFRIPLGVSFTWTPLATKRIFPSRPSPDREAVRAELISSGVLGADAYVVVAGPANTYGHYIATREEYAVQRYEGASTIFGQCECYLPQACASFILRKCYGAYGLWFNLKLSCLVFLRDLMDVESPPDSWHIHFFAQ